MRVSRLLLALGAAAAASLLAAGSWLAGTEAGLRFLVARAGAFVPGTLHIGAVQGRLIGPMVLSEVHWTLDGAGGTAQRLELDWHPLALLRREVHLQRLHLQGIVVDLPAPDTADPQRSARGTDWQDIALPWGVVVEALAIDGVRLRRDGAELGEITTLRGALRAGGRTLSLQDLVLSSPQGAASGRLAASLNPRAAWDVALAWEIFGADRGITGATRITGVLPDLQLQQALSQPAVADISGRLRGLPEAPEWDLRLELQPLPAGDSPWPETLHGASAGVDIVGSIEATRVQGEIAWPDLLETAAEVDAALGWRDSSLMLDAVTIAFAPASTLAVQGRLVPGATPEIELQGRATGITWPLQGRDPLLTLPALEFTGDSTGAAWRLSAQGEVAPSSAPAAQLDLQARGDETSLRVEALELGILGGTVTGAGTAEWRDHPAADFLLQVAGLDPSGVAPEWPGRIAGTLHLHGSLGPGQRFQVDGRDITGELRGQPLSGAFTAALGEDALDLTEAALSLGSASLQASGTVDRDQVALRARLDAPQLEELGPGISGRIAARAQIVGQRTAPVIELHAEGGRLSWGGLRARMLQADASVDLSGENASRVEAELAGIAARPGRSATLRLEASGRPEDHAVQLEFTRRRPQQRLAAALTGRLEEARWQGLLGAVSVVESERELWRLQAPAGLSASADRLQLEQACMEGILGLLCLEAERIGARRWQGEAELARLDLGPLSEWLGLGLAASGALSGEVRLTTADDRFLDLDGGFQLGAGDISRRGQREGTLLSWAGGELALAGDTEAAAADLRLVLGDNNLVRGRLRAGWNEPDPWLQGTLEAELDRLTLVPELVPELSTLGGEIGLRLALDGTLAAPAPSGRLEWRNGVAAIPELGLAPEDIQLRADIAPGVLKFRATGQSGEGRFATEGEFDLRAEGVSGEASLQGENLTVANLPDIVVVAEPDLRFGFRGKRLNIGGDVHIPSALISGLGSSGAVRNSPDEVIVGARARDAAEEGVTISSRIRVSAGPAVQLQVGGFSGRVEGSVLTVVQPEADPWGRGELRVVDGEMSVLGQTLAIETGRLIYDGGPLENPGLEIRAVRQVRDVTAGALVRGTVQQPQISIFSEPAMSNAEALSYLTLGKSLEQIQSGERQTMNQAANALALSGGGLVMQDLARRLGFQDLEVSAETGDNGSALVVSKYLGGGLYVSYGLGLFDTVNTLRLRYQFNRRLSLEAESGEEASADLFYSFERD